MTMGTYGPNGTNDSFGPGDLPFKLSHVRNGAEMLLSPRHREIDDTLTPPPADQRVCAVHATGSPRRAAWLANLFHI